MTPEESATSLWIMLQWQPKDFPKQDFIRLAAHHFDTATREAVEEERGQQEARHAELIAAFRALSDKLNRI